MIFLSVEAEFIFIVKNVTKSYNWTTGSKGEMMKSIVRCIIRYNGKYLLLKRLPEEGGFWYFPGGKIKNRETLLKAIQREVYEETYIMMDISKLKQVHIFKYAENYLTKEIELWKETIFFYEVSQLSMITINDESKMSGLFTLEEAIQVMKEKSVDPWRANNKYILEFVDVMY